MFKLFSIFLIFLSLSHGEDSKRYSCKMTALNMVPVTERQKASFGEISNPILIINSIKAKIVWGENSISYKYKMTDPRTTFEIYLDDTGVEKLNITSSRDTVIMASGQNVVHYDCR
ncbi:MAG: hypothetical protein ACNI28_10330 [Arcobacter sp.]|uniref:hypothetical protein n=1 Tax=Arcobacter sp. TaxID=1872629 RepID=UPI003B00E9DC